MDTGIPVSQPLNPALDIAVARAGSQQALGRAISRRQQTVWEWQRQTGRVPAEAAVAIERATGVPAEAICPALAEFAVLRGLPVRQAA